MTRRRPLTNINFDDQPSLFDDLPGPTIHVHPAIKAHVESVRRQEALSREAEARFVDALPAGVPRRRALRFISFGSGSSGNCSYIGDGTSGVLIDAGVDADHVQRTLLANGITMDSVDGICLTHDHGDHVSCAYTLLRSNKHMRLFCTPKTLNGLLRRHNISRRVKDYHQPIYKEFEFQIGALTIVPFDVSHDGTDNCGFFVTGAGTTFAIATDLGCITDRVDHYMRQAENIVIEANYDEAMLRAGRYPVYLKSRIMAERGHLDNVVTGRFLAGILNDKLKRVFLCHLSHDNNTPQLALGAVRKALTEAGVESIGDGSFSLEAERCRLQLAALPRYEASPMYTLV